MTPMPITEKYLSQIPALIQLVKLGYEYVTPEAARRERGGRLSGVFLEDTLRDQLKKINRVRTRGAEYLFSEENIQEAVQRLKNVKFDGLQRTNEVVYDLLTLGVSLEQTVDGSTKSFHLSYIDWEHPESNRFQVTAEFPLERERSSETTRPDIVLFVNGIPLAVIECKAPSEDLNQAVSQMLRNQGDDYSPRFFAYTQLVLAVNKNGATYATAGTPKKFWALWKELGGSKKDVLDSISRPLSPSQSDALFSGGFAQARTWFEGRGSGPDRELTEQDTAIHSLCRPERLLELTYKFIVVEGGVKKIARYQQYFVVKSAIERLKDFDSERRRRGGVVWHTQGSGKSLTQVMLARSLALSRVVPNPRIVLVSDRDDLDVQLGNTFAACGLSPERAESGKHLLKLLADDKAAIVTTLIHKFAKAMDARAFEDPSPDVFLLVDEGHRTNYGSFAAGMRKMFPRACYLAFTGTPLLKKEKNSFAKFGSLIEPHYSIRQAVEDGAVVPLLYEGRLTEMRQDKEAIDLWFERHSSGLSVEQKADLKRKYSRSEALQKADRVVYLRAFDISRHFAEHWKGTPFKAQLVAPSKLTALLYKKYLDEFGEVSSEVVISPPDVREGYEDIDEEPSDEVVSFWRRMMKAHGSEDRYVKNIVGRFKNAEEPEILIVVDKLLTGFDAPRNTVLYLCRTLREHTLLQAIARVNRLYDGKEYGYVVDHTGCLGELDKALTMYDAFSDYDEADLQGTIADIREEVKKLPQRHSDLWDLFKTLRSCDDEDAYERLLADRELRDRFYDRLAAYLRTLGIALSSERFIAETLREKIEEYKADLRRFRTLKAAVQRRYAETVDYRDYEPRIKKLLDTHLGADTVTSLNEPVNIFDDASFWEVKAEQEVYGDKALGAKADMIAHATARTIHERMEEDPAFYKRFSVLIQETIDEFRSRRISESEYLDKASSIREAVESKRHDDAPAELSGREHALAFYGVALPCLGGDGGGDDAARARECAVRTALAVDETLGRHWKVRFWDDPDSEKLVRNDMDDFFFDTVKGTYGIDLPVARMDELMDQCLAVARRRMS